MGARSVLRQHLLYRLQQSRRCRLVLVSGGAGYGKTTLLAQWRRELLKSGEHVAWLSLVAEDGQLAPFCASLIGALREAGVPIDEALPCPAGADRASSPEPFAWALVNALAKAPHDVHLLIDNLHHVDDPEVHRLLQAPFDCGPDRLYLLLASRSAPGLLLGRLRASCDLLEIECADLRFDFHESLSFLKDNLDATIDADGAHWMHALADGCPACAIKDQCTTGDYRRIRRWEHEEVFERVQQRLDKKPEAMTLRRRTVEHVFGTLKHWMGSTHFLTKTLAHVGTEMSLHVLAYNLKRVIAVLSMRKTMKAVRQLGISKRGDAYLRTLLMHGARAVVIRSKDGPTWPWLTALLQRRPYSVAVAAVANKLARTIWAVLARGQAWHPEAWQTTH
ncbi:Serine/threonine-protein kinase PknK [compost metagenome]